MKPIAEIVWAGGIEGSIKDVRFYKVPSPDVGTKLYTHPVKELTDEEILYFYKPCFYHAEDFVSDIRAILKRASEK